MRSSSKSRNRNRNGSRRGNTGGNIINRVFESAGPEGKVRGTPQQIIDKYKDDPDLYESGRLLPMYSNPMINRTLKDIAKVCGIHKKVTFHVARHTFATAITLSNGVPIETVSKLLGHTKLSTTQIYARVVEKKVGEDMQNLMATMKLKKYRAEEVS